MADTTALLQDIFKNPYCTHKKRRLQNSLRFIIFFFFNSPSRGRQRYMAYILKDSASSFSCTSSTAPGINAIPTQEQRSIS